MLQDLFPDICIYLRALSQDAELSQDLAQETLIRAITAREIPQERPALRAWMLRVAKNLFIDEVRKTKVRMEYERSQARLVDETLKSRLQPVVDRIIIQEAFAKLPEAHREVVLLVDVLGMSYAEVGETLDIAIGTVMSRISRARKSMISLMKDGTVQQIDSYRKEGRQP